MSTIIGFGYRSRSGKDTAAATIIASVGTGTVEGIDVRRYAFADALKREVNEAARLNGGIEALIAIGKDTGLPSGDTFVQRVVMPEWVKFDPSAPMDDPLCPLGKQRLLLQWWGTEYRRTEDEDYWVKQLKRSVDTDQPDYALVTDFRFPNEAKVLDFKVKVERGVSVLDHPSEHALDNFEGWDTTILNDGSLEDFREKVLMTFKFIRDYVAGRTSYFQAAVKFPITGRSK